jgi:hypothetical protein
MEYRLGRWHAPDHPKFSRNIEFTQTSRSPNELVGGSLACGTAASWRFRAPAVATGNVGNGLFGSGIDIRGRSVGHVNSDLCFEIIDRVILCDWNADFQGHVVSQVPSHPAVERKK